MTTGKTSVSPSSPYAPASGEMQPRKRGLLWIGILTLLSAVSPLACDMYLPGFPGMAEEFQTSTIGLQLTMTAFLLGLAIGQLAMGPLSDWCGRRQPLLWSLAACVLTGVACALATNIEILILFRFFQGLSGSACIVLSRSVVADSSRGAESQRIFSVMTAVGGLAPVVAPLIGALIIAFFGWRETFWLLVLITVVMFLGVFWKVPESLSAERRNRGRAKDLYKHAERMFRDHHFVALALTFALSFAVMFSYIPASPFVLQDAHGLGPNAFAAVFALNAFGLIIASVAAGRLAGVVPALRLAAIGVSAQVVATVTLLILSILGALPTWGLIAGLFVSITGLGLVAGPTTALALDRVPFAVGTGAAVLGALQFGLGAAVTPLAGLQGANIEQPMLIVMALMALGAAVAMSITGRKSLDHRSSDHRRAVSSSETT